jgi:hypothetical protein
MAGGFKSDYVVLEDKCMKFFKIKKNNKHILHVNINFDLYKVEVSISLIGHPSFTL